MTNLNHQFKQKEIINALASQVHGASLHFTTVSPVADFAHDPRICLTSVHLPHNSLLSTVEKTFIEPLRKIEPNIFYYSNDNLHMTIKNVRVIHDPPHYTDEDVQKVKNIFNETIPQHKKFNVYFYRLLLFPNNLALIGTTDEELDNIILDIDKKLKVAGISDDKKYINSQYFFSNMTLARFREKPSDAFIQKVTELSESCTIKPYQVDSVTLLTSNAVLKNRHIRGTWKLR